MRGIIMENENQSEPKKESIRDYLTEDKKKQITIPLSDINNTNNPINKLVHRPTPKPKLIVIKSIHHRKIDGSVQSLPIRHSRELGSEDDSILRTITVDNEWKLIDTSWIGNNIGYFSLRNNGWKPFQTIPTVEQMKDAWSRVIEVGYKIDKQVVQERLPHYNKNNPRTAFDTNEPISVSTIIQEIEPFWLIYPGESMDGRPCNNREIYVRCQHEQTYLTIFVVPA